MTDHPAARIDLPDAEAGVDEVHPPLPIKDDAGAGIGVGG
jgi:hypothetical protein